jgi:DNA-binding transcriptional MerR regulator
MAINLNELTKLYYTIGEVAEMFNVSKSLIRFWESEFDLLRPHKNSKGDRRFTKQNISQFNTIYHLVKERGFTLDGAKNELKTNKDRIINRQKTLESLNKIRGFLVDLKEKV